MHLKHISILGSTGSIGTQALEVVRDNAELYTIDALTAQENYKLLIEQALEFKPKLVVIGNTDHFDKVKMSLPDFDVQTGKPGLLNAVNLPSTTIVLTALVGAAGLEPTIAAIKAGKNIALANKETLVVAGELIMGLATSHNVEIIPVDSEHSALFQCLVGEDYNTIEKIYLTASGGPFLGKDLNYLATVSKEQALKHPNWAMGAKITIDSASLMNKGLEVIEAKWLFGLKPEQIDVIVHPQSIIHSIVQFKDGSMKAQMGLPDMKLPIHYALNYPQRITTSFPRFNFMDFPTLSFLKPDKEVFANLGLAYQAMEKGGNMPTILNAANEVAVDAFLKDKIGFLEMSNLIKKCMEEVEFNVTSSIENFVDSDKKTRIFAEKLLNS